MTLSNLDAFQVSFFPLVLVHWQGTSGALLHGRGRSGHSCLVPELQRKAFWRFTVEYDVGSDAVGQVAKAYL